MATTLARFSRSCKHEAPEGWVERNLISAKEARSRAPGVGTATSFTTCQAL
jgi:hypothetical protein